MQAAPRFRLPTLHEEGPVTINTQASSIFPLTQRSDTSAIDIDIDMLHLTTTPGILASYAC